MLAGEYMLEVDYAYATDEVSVDYVVRTDRFTIADEPPSLAVGLSRAHALLELEIGETGRPVHYPTSTHVRREMLRPQVEMDQAGTPRHRVRVVSAVATRVN